MRKKFDDFAGKGRPFGEREPLQAARGRIMLGRGPYEYPICSKAETVAMLYSVADALAAVDNHFNALGLAVNNAVLSAVANAIQYLEEGPDDGGELA